MIVQIRGASGSGKSTLVRAFLKKHGPVASYNNKRIYGLEHVVSPASRPFALRVETGLATPVFVPGHYEAPDGGCDMIKSVDHLYDIAIKGLDHGDVLMEGLFVSKDVNKLKQRLDVYSLVPNQLIILYLDLPEATCEESVQLRREGLGKPRQPLAKHSSDYREGEVQSAVKKLKALGIVVEHHTRESAAERLEELLGDET